MPEPDLEPGEKLLSEWRPDRGRYWRAHAGLALLGSVGAGLVLWALAIPAPAAGALGAAAAVAVRAAWLAPEALAEVWRLTDRRLLLPAGRAVGLPEIVEARLLLGDVQIITRAGDKHLLRYLARPAAARAAIEASRSRRARRAG
jgi:hypothetical protein